MKVKEFLGNADRWTYSVAANLIEKAGLNFEKGRMCAHNYKKEAEEQVKFLRGEVDQLRKKANDLWDKHDSQWDYLRAMADVHAKESELHKAEAKLHHCDF